VAQARAAAEAAAQSHRAAERAQWLWPSFVEVDFVRERSGGPDRVLFQAGVDLPVAGEGAAVAAARAQRTRHEVVVAEQRIAREVEAARLAYRLSAELVAQLEKEMPALDASRRLVAEGMRAHAPPGEIWQLARATASAQRQLARARTAHALRAIDLRLRLGQE
jgi:hypothetical protein